MPEEESLNFLLLQLWELTFQMLTTVLEMQTVSAVTGSRLSNSDIRFVLKGIVKVICVCI